MKFSLPQLRAFASIAETHSFSMSAARLHVSQPTLSATIRTLEELVGARLFDRDTRNIALTPVGREFLAMAQRVLGEVERAQRDLREFLGGHRGRVRFSALPVLYRFHLPQAITAFRQACPEIELQLSDLSTEAAVERLRDGSLDLAVVTAVQTGAALDCVPIATQTIAALLPASHAMARLPAIPWAALRNEPTVVLNSGGVMSAYCDQVLFQAGIRFAGTYRVEQLVAAAGLVQAGLGIGVMSGYSARAMATDGLVHLPLVEPTISRPICLASITGRELSPAARRLRDTVVNQFAQATDLL
jgi:DNA-binding transcriptional LysR family regulator